jgi:hypothetical protein
MVRAASFGEQHHQASSAYTRSDRYHDREQVNDLGHGGLPVGVVSAAVCLALTRGCNRTRALVADRMTGLFGGPSGHVDGLGVAREPADPGRRPKSRSGPRAPHPHGTSPACNRSVVSVAVAMHEEHAVGCRFLCRHAGSHSDRAAGFSGCDSPCRLVPHLWRLRRMCRERQRDRRNQEHLRSRIRLAQSVSRCVVVDGLREGLRRRQQERQLHGNHAHPPVPEDAVLPPEKLLGRHERSAVGQRQPPRVEHVPPSEWHIAEAGLVPTEARAGPVIRLASRRSRGCIGSRRAQRAGTMRYSYLDSRSITTLSPSRR